MKGPLKLLRSEQPNMSDADAASEVKGMHSRVARRDQWDWRAVQLVLGNPSRRDARTIANILDELSRALRQGDADGTRRSIEAVRGWEGLTDRLRHAADAIRNSAPELTGAHARNTRVGEGRKSEGVPQSVLSIYTKEKLDSANTTHEMLLDILGQFLESSGHRVEANQHVDAFTRLRSGPAIFEAKSITDNNEVSQVRSGLSQLYEYRYRHGVLGATLWLLLSRKPKKEWIVDYLVVDRDVRLLWIDEGRLSGPSVDQLLESGSAFRRRECKSRTEYPVEDER